MQRIVCFLILVLASVSCLSGCGSGRQPLGKVTGTVTFEGEPVREGSIVFEVPGMRPASGKIVDGRITEVTTFDPNDGVPLGVAKIAVHAFGGEGAGAGAVAAHPGDIQPTDMSGYMGVQASLIPPHYNDPASSDLTFEIGRGENNVILELKR
jgi:hypothetical protein